IQAFSFTGRERGAQSIAMACPTRVGHLPAFGRLFGTILVCVALAGCMMARSIELADDRKPAAPIDPAIMAMYGPVREGPLLLPAVDVRRIEPEYFRQVVPIPAGIPDEPSIVVVDPGHRFFYLVVGDGQAIRYGIGVGREGFA